MSRLCVVCMLRAYLSVIGVSVGHTEPVWGTLRPRGRSRGDCNGRRAARCRRVQRAAGAHSARAGRPLGGDTGTIPCRSQAQPDRARLRPLADPSARVVHRPRGLGSLPPPPPPPESFESVPQAEAAPPPSVRSSTAAARSRRGGPVPARWRVNRELRRRGGKWGAMRAAPRGALF